MFYIKHPEHGFLAVEQLDATQRAAGWERCNIYEEIKKRNLAKLEEREKALKDTAEEFARAAREAGEALKKAKTPKRKTIAEMNKPELLEYAKGLGIKLDGRKTALELLGDLEKALLPPEEQ